MTTHIAFLRGINVGGNSKVEMSRLKQAFEELGYTHILTYINSGNVIFSSDKDEYTLKQTIEKKLLTTFKFVIRVIVRDNKNIQTLIKKIPKEWKNNLEQKTDILFLWGDYNNKKSLDLITSNKEVDTLLYIDGAIIWHVNKNNYNKSGMHKFIGTELYKNMTARNVNTVRKVGDLMKYLQLES